MDGLLRAPPCPTHSFALASYLFCSWSSCLPRPWDMGLRLYSLIHSCCSLLGLEGEIRPSGQPPEALSAWLPVSYEALVCDLQSMLHSPCPTSLSSLINTMRRPLGFCSVCWLREPRPSLHGPSLELKTYPRCALSKKTHRVGREKDRARGGTRLPDAPLPTRSHPGPGGRPSAAQKGLVRGGGEEAESQPHCPSLRPERP